MNSFTPSLWSWYAMLGSIGGGSETMPALSATERSMIRI